MAQQLVITSLEKTLSGGSGYGLAGASPGIPEPVRKKVLSLAGFGFVRCTPSPVNWVNLKIETLTGSISLIGRISEAPNDYSGRDNFIAHLLLIQPGELASFHPGQILEKFPWITSWNGPARSLDAPKLPIGLPSYPITPSTWEEITGDRGFAGYPWDCQELGTRFLFSHDKLDPNKLSGLLIESLSMAPPQRAWSLTFSTHAEDFPEAHKCTLVGTHAASRMAQKWDQERVAHWTFPISPGASSLVAPQGSAVIQARRQFTLLPEIRQSRSTQKANRQTELLLDSEAVQEAVLNPINHVPAPPPPGPGTTDPWRMLFPGALGFFLGIICTAIPFILGLIFLLPSREKDGGIPGGEVRDPIKEKKGPEANKEKQNPQAIKGENQEPKEPEKPIAEKPVPWDNLAIAPLSRFAARPLEAAQKMIDLFRLPDGPAATKDQWVRQAALLARLQSLQGWSADQRALLRPDRFFILVRQLENEKPALEDPFSHSQIDLVKTPLDEVVWISAGARHLRSNDKSGSLALLSLVANQNRIRTKLESVTKQANEKGANQTKLDGAYWRDNREALKKRLHKDDFEILDPNFQDGFKNRLETIHEILEKYQTP